MQAAGMSVPSLSPIWTVTPLELGSRMAPASWFRYLDTASEPVRIAYRAWLLRSGSSVVLVDTGPPPSEAQRRGIEGVVSIQVRIQELGIEPGEITDIVLTHLHWDHAAALDLFAHARVFVQRAELDFFRGWAWENPATSRFFNRREALETMLDAVRVVPVDGDAEPWPGIRLMRVGGHTPGSQMVGVHSSLGLAVLTGDAIPMNRNYVDDMPTGILVSLSDVLAARRRLRDLGPDVLYTGHDPQPLLQCHTGE